MGFYARLQNNGVIPSEPVGKRLTHSLETKDPVTAYTLFQQIDQDFERIQRGLAPVNIPTNTDDSGVRTLTQAVAAFERDLIAKGKKRRAAESYVSRVRNFARFFESRPNIALDRITDTDTRNFLVWLPKNIRLRAGSEGHVNNTLRNHLRDAKIMFTRYKVVFPLANKYWPKKIDKRKWKYSTDSIKAMLAATERADRHDNNHWSKQDEQDMVHFLLNTGFRDEEVAHAQYKDINFKKGSINVYVQPEFSWTPKNSKSRSQDIDLSESFLDKMKARRDRYTARRDRT